MHLESLLPPSISTSLQVLYKKMRAPKFAQMKKTDYFCGTQASVRYLKGKDKGRY